MAFVCNHGHSASSSHHHCTVCLQPPPPQHHCEQEHTHSPSHAHPPGHTHCSSCHPSPGGVVPPPPPDCTCCSHGVSLPPSPLHPPHMNSHSWFPSHPPSHPHTHSPSPHVSHPHTPTSHHPPPTPTSHHPYTPTSHHPHTLTSHHPPHTPTSHHPPHPHTPISQHHSPFSSSHPHIPMSHPPASHHHTPTSYRASPGHYSTSHHAHKPPFAASPLHHTHLWHHAHPPPSIHASQHSHHGTDARPPPSAVSCTNPSCQHHKSVCQVHPTRRQLIPPNTCVDSSESHQQPTQPQFIAESPSQQHVAQRMSDQLPTTGSHHSNYIQPLLRTTDCETGVTPYTPEYQTGVAPEGTSERPGLGHSDDSNTLTLPETVYSTPPPTQPHSRMQQPTLVFSPYDSSTFSQTNFELAVPPPLNMNIPVNHLQTQDPQSHQHVLSRTIDNPPDPPSTATPSSSQSSRVYAEPLDTATTEHPQPAPEKRSSWIPCPSSAASPLPVKPLSSFANDEKIGKERLVLHKCITGDRKPDSSIASASVNSISFDLEKTHLKESGYSETADNSSSSRVEPMNEEVKETLEDCESSERKDVTATEEVKVEEADESKPCRVYTRSLAKLPSDSELSLSESELSFATTSAAATRSRLKRRDRQSGKSDRDLASEVGRVGGPEEVGPDEMTVDTVAGESESEYPNIALIKMENLSPISMRTRSKVLQTDSSQSDSERVPSQVGREKVMARLKKRKVKGKQTVGVEVKGEESDSEPVAPHVRRLTRSARFLSETSESESSTAPLRREQQQQQQTTQQQTKQQQQTAQLADQQQQTVQHQQQTTQLPDQQQQTTQDSKQQQTTQSEPQQQTTQQFEPQQQTQEPNQQPSLPSAPSTSMCSISPESHPAGADSEAVTLSSSTQTPSEAAASVSLTDWYIRIAGRNLVIVEGMKNDDKRRIWHSGPIVKRLSPRLVATRSGSTYYLEGALNRAGVEKLGIETLTVQFKDGFPEDWLAIIQRYLLQKCMHSEGMTEDGGRQSADEGRRGQKEGDLDMGGEESEGMSEGHRGQERRDFDKGDKESEGGHREQERRDLDKGGEESEGMSESNKGQEKRDLDKGGEESEGMSESNKGQEKRDLDKGGEKTGEGEEGESSEVERGRELQLVTDDDADVQRDEEMEVERKKREEDVGPAVTSTPVAVAQDSSSEAVTEGGVTPIISHVKTEQAELTTPLDTSTASSSFISSLKRSSRGRTLKPSSSSLSIYADVYSYDMCGNFIGLTSPVIDLTVVPDTSGFLTSGNESTLWDQHRVKCEPMTECGNEGTESESDSVPVVKEKVKKRGHQSQRDRSGKIVARDEMKKNSKRRSRGIIPLALRRSKKLVQEVDSEVGEDVSTEDVVEETNSQKSGYGGEDGLSNEGERGGRGNKKRVGGRGGERRKQEKLQEESEAEAKSILEETGSQQSGHGDDVGTSCKEGGRGRRGRRTLRQDEQEHKAETETVSSKEKSDSNVASKRVQSANSTDTVKAVPPAVAERNMSREAKSDYLVGYPECKEDICSGAKVKVQHKKKAKKRVSISNEVTVMGGVGGWWRGREDKGRGREDKGREREGGEEEKWSATELDKLSNVVLSVPALEKNFWEEVATRLGSHRSSEECYREYAKIKERRRRKKKMSGHDTRKDKTAAPPPPLTAGVGTLKRKRQVRDILDHLDSGHSDDCFTSTPFKKSRLKDKLEEDSVEEEEEHEDRLLTTPREAYRKMGGPSTHTPRLCDYGATPDYKGGPTQEAADHVIYKKQKAKKAPKLIKPMPSKHHGHSSLTKKTQQLRPTSHRNLHRIHSGEMTVLRRFDDSDDSCDSNPFSDMEDACQDVIARLH